MAQQGNLFNPAWQLGLFEPKAAPKSPGLFAGLAAAGAELAARFDAPRPERAAHVGKERARAANERTGQRRPSPRAVYDLGSGIIAAARKADPGAKLARSLARLEKFQGTAADMRRVADALEAAGDVERARYVREAL